MEGNRRIVLRLVLALVWVAVTIALFVQGNIGMGVFFAVVAVVLLIEAGSARKKSGGESVDR